MNLLVSTGVAVERQCTQGANQSRPGSAKEREHRSGNSRTRFEIENPELERRVPVWDLLVIGELGKGTALIHAGPPTAQLDVVVLVDAVGDAGVRKVRNHQEFVAQLVADPLHGLGRRALILAQRPALLGQ